MTVGLIGVPQAGAATVPKFTLGVRSVTLDAGRSAPVPVVFSSARVGTLRWSMEGLPAGVNATIACTTSRRCTVTLNAATNAPSAAVGVDVVFRSGTSERRAVMPLVVRGVAAPPATLPPAPPPTAAPTTTAPAAAQDFTLRADNLVASGMPGGDVWFNLTLTRANWTGPITLRVDTMPANFRAAFLPANPTSTNANTLVVSVPAGTPNGDYPVRISAASKSLRVETTLVVAVRFPQLSLNVTNALSATVGSSVTFAVDARSIDDPTRPVFLNVEGLPSGVGAVFSPNPVTGTSTVTISVASSAIPGAYPINFVASRSDVIVRSSAVLTIAGRSTFVFTPTAVTNSEPRGYALSASTGSLTVVRGGIAFFDVTVSPKGGFIDPISVVFDVPAGFGVGYSILGPNQFRVTFTVPATATVGTYSLPLLTSAGGLSASVAIATTIS